MLCGMNGLSLGLSHAGSEKVECSQLKVRKLIESESKATPAPSLPLSSGMDRVLPAVLLAAAKLVWSFDAQLGCFLVLAMQVSKGWRAAGMGGPPWRKNVRSTRRPRIEGPRRSWSDPAVTAATCLGHQGEVPAVQVRSHSLLRGKAAPTAPACPQGRSKSRVQGSHPGHIRRAHPFLRAWKETATHH